MSAKTAAITGLSVVCTILMTLSAGCTERANLAVLPVEPDSEVRSLCESGRYHEAMRQLPEVMAQWEEYTRRTGQTAEGAAGYIYSTTMFDIAERGDADWGRILDDPNIPYEYKTTMIFEIAEMRLGKGSAWSPYHTDVVIIPRACPVDSWKDVNDLLRHALSAHDALIETDKPNR